MCKTGKKANQRSIYIQFAELSKSIAVTLDEPKVFISARLLVPLIQQNKAGDHPATACSRRIGCPARRSRLEARRSLNPAEAYTDSCLDDLCRAGGGAGVPVFRTAKGLEFRPLMSNTVHSDPKLFHPGAG